MSRRRAADGDAPMASSVDFALWELRMRSHCMSHGFRRAYGNPEWAASPTALAEKPWVSSKASTMEVLDCDMHEVLMAAKPRQIGEAPPDLGGYQCIAPSPMYDAIAKYRRQPRAKPKLTGDGLTSVSIAADGKPDGKRK